MVIVLLLAVLLHFSLIFCKTSGLKINNSISGTISNLYTYPYFHQNWNVFVPAPSVKRTLMARYQMPGGNWSRWHDIGCSAISSAKKHPASGTDMIWLLWSNTLHYSAAALPKESSEYYGVPRKFDPLTHLVNRHMKHCFHLSNGTPCEWLIVNRAEEKTYATYFKNLAIN